MRAILSSKQKKQMRSRPVPDMRSDNTRTFAAFETFVSKRPWRFCAGVSEKGTLWFIFRQKVETSGLTVQYSDCFHIIFSLARCSKKLPRSPGNSTSSTQKVETSQRAGFQKWVFEQAEEVKDGPVTGMRLLEGVYGACLFFCLQHCRSAERRPFPSMLRHHLYNLCITITRKMLFHHFIFTARHNERRQNVSNLHPWPSAPDLWPSAWYK